MTKKYKLGFSWFAKEQLDESMDYYNQKKEGLGYEFWKEIIAKADKIEQNPYQFPKSDFGTRKATLKRFPFRIFYRIKEIYIEVIAVLHHSRDTKELEKE